MNHYDIFIIDMDGNRVFIGTIEDPGRIARRRLRAQARARFPKIQGLDDAHIAVVRTPRTPAERDRTYAPKG